MKSLLMLSYALTSLFHVLTGHYWRKLHQSLSWNLVWILTEEPKARHELKITAPLDRIPLNPHPRFDEGKDTYSRTPFICQQKLQMTTQSKYRVRCEPITDHGESKHDHWIFFYAFEELGMKPSWCLNLTYFCLNSWLAFRTVSGLSGVPLSSDRLAALSWQVSAQELPLLTAPQPCYIKAIGTHDFMQLSSHLIPNFKGKPMQNILDNLILIEFVG